MKFSFLATFAMSVSLLFCHLPAQAADERMGLGFVFGSPTSITGKMWKANDRAIDLGIGYWFGDYYDIYADYLFHFPAALSRSQNPLPQFSPYIGVGADLQLLGKGNTSSSVGVFCRVPLGVEWLPTNAPIGVFFEIVPTIRIISGIAGYLGSGLGIRFYFQ